MKEMVPYLTFNGDCKAAMEFYHAALGGELQIMRFADMPNCPPGSEDRVLHSNIRSEIFTLMASDGMPNVTVTPGDNFSISLDTSSLEENKRLFTALSEGGTMTMELQDTFWGANFGTVKDKFGISWMFNYDKGQHPSA